MEKILLKRKFICYFIIILTANLLFQCEIIIAMYKIQLKIYKKRKILIEIFLKERKSFEYWNVNRFTFLTQSRKCENSRYKNSP